MATGEGEASPFRSRELLWQIIHPMRAVEYGMNHNNHNFAPVPKFDNGLELPLDRCAEVMFGACSR